MYPLKLSSVLKDIIWGGTLLSEKYNKGVAGQKIAEAWVLSCRNDGENIIENGEYTGKALSEIYPDKDSFPLLIKLIDACDKLSVQVHPDDSYAQKEGLPAGKTEMWYILDAIDGAKLVYGMRKDIPLSDAEIKIAAENGTLESYLNYCEVKKGDVFFIPAGLVHAIGKGILIAEVQQNSNTTYRMYDYDRRDKDGNRRELHIDKAIEVIDKTLPHGDNTAEMIEKNSCAELTKLCECEYFKAHSLKVEMGSYPISPDKMFFVLCTDGSGEIIHNSTSYPFEKGDSYLFPQGTGAFEVKAEKCELLLASE